MNDMITTSVRFNKIRNEETGRRRPNIILL